MIFVGEMSYDDWVKWRLAGLGSSDAAAVMGASKWETTLELWARRTGRLEPQKDNFAMRRGRMLEPEARKEYERRTGIAMPKQLGIHDEHAWIRASYDGFNKENNLALEIKCPGVEDHAKACRLEVPEHYVWQCVHLMLVSGHSEIDYFSYNRKTSAIVTLKRDSEREARYLERAAEFWKYVERDTTPPDSFLNATKKKPTSKKWDFPVRRAR